MPASMMGYLIPSSLHSGVLMGGGADMFTDFSCFVLPEVNTVLPRILWRAVKQTARSTKVNVYRCGGVMHVSLEPNEPRYTVSFSKRLRLHRLEGSSTAGSRRDTCALSQTEVLQRVKRPGLGDTVAIAYYGGKREEGGETEGLGQWEVHQAEILTRLGLCTSELIVAAVRINR